MLCDGRARGIYARAFDVLEAADWNRKSKFHSKSFAKELFPFHESPPTVCCHVQLKKNSKYFILKFYNMKIVNRNALTSSHDN